MAPFCLKHMNTLIWVHREANTSCCWLQDMQQIFGFSSKTLLFDYSSRSKNWLRVEIFLIIIRIFIFSSCVLFCSKYNWVIWPLYSKAEMNILNNYYAILTKCNINKSINKHNMKLTELIKSSSINYLYYLISILDELLGRSNKQFPIWNI